MTARIPMSKQKSFVARRPMPCYTCGGTIKAGEEHGYAEIGKSGAEVAVCKECMGDDDG